LMAGSVFLVRRHNGCESDGSRPRKAIRSNAS
jgi:hypothetical protein